MSWHGLLFRRSHCLKLIILRVVYHGLSGLFCRHRAGPTEALVSASVMLLPNSNGFDLKCQETLQRTGCWHFKRVICLKAFIMFAHLQIEQDGDAD